MGELLDDAVTAARKRLGFGALTWATVVLLVALSKAVGLAAAGRLILFFASLVALAIGGLFQCVNTLTRPFLGHWEGELGARTLLVIEAVLGLLLVVGGFYGTVASSPQAWILTLVYLPPAFVYWHIEVDIAARVIDGGKRLGTSHVMGLRPFGTTTLGESATVAEKTPQGGLLVKLFGPLPPTDRADAPAIAPTLFDWAEEESKAGSDAFALDSLDIDRTDNRSLGPVAEDTGPAAPSPATESGVKRPVVISVTRIWVAIALALVFLACLATATGLAAESVVHHYAATHPQAGGATAPTTPTAPTASTTTTPTGPKPRTLQSPTTPAASPPPEPQQVYWTTVCPSVPGEGAPAWAKQALYDFYLGVNGVGALQGGCTGHAIVVSDDFTYEVGTDPGTGALKSIAVASKRWPGAIFLSPLAERVRELIAIYGSIGGSERHDVLNGDYQLVYVPAGTIAFVRETKTDFSGDATPYVELPPPVSDDWFAASQTNGWLWPELVESKGGAETFRFVTSAITENVAETVRYEKRSGRALRQINGEWVANIATGQQIADATVQEVAAGAR